MTLKQMTALEAKGEVNACAVIVTYRPTNELIENVEALLDQVGQVVIVDNGSGPESKKLFEKLVCHSNVYILNLQENLGIAAALNIGVKKAKADGFQWVATFDQDSQPTPHMIETMRQAYDTYPLKEKVASLSPRYKDKDTGAICGSTAVLPPGGNIPYAEAKVVITSGNLLKTNIFDVVGYFNEELFIDYVDTEYCLRCVTHGFRILEVSEAILLHNVGTPSRHKLLWRNPMISNHSALRRYYFARNAIYTYKKYIVRQPVWVLKNAYTLAKIMIVVALFETDRIQKIAAFMRGFGDGLLGRMGKCNRAI